METELFLICYWLIKRYNLIAGGPGSVPVTGSKADKYSAYIYMGFFLHIKLYILLDCKSCTRSYQRYIFTMNAGLTQGGAVAPGSTPATSTDQGSRTGADRGNGFNY